MGLVPVIIFGSVTVVVWLLAAWFVVAGVGEFRRDRAWARGWPSGPPGAFGPRERVPGLELVGAGAARQAAGDGSVRILGDVAWSGEDPAWDCKPMAAVARRPGSAAKFDLCLGLALLGLAVVLGFFAVRLVDPGVPYAFDIPLVDVPWVSVHRG